MHPKLRIPRAPLWTLLGLAMISLMLPLTSATPAPAFSQPNPGNPPATWAWGANFEKDAQGSITGTGAGNLTWTASYTIHEYVGWAVLVTQTNTSSTTFTLQSQRGLVAAFFLSLSGTSGLESLSGNITAQGWETDNETAHFLTTGTVLVNGTTPMAALAVSDFSGTTAGNFTTTESGQWSTPQATGSVDSYASAAAQAHASVSLSPALGLFPMNLPSGSWWTSTSNWSAQGGYSVACHWGYSATGARGSLGSGGNCGRSGSVSGSGIVTLYGADLDLEDVAGHFYHMVSDTFAPGFPFQLHDGLLFVHGDADLFGGSAPSGSTGTMGGAPNAGASLGTNSFEVDPHATGHVGIMAANASFAPQSVPSIGMMGITQPGVPAPTSAALTASAAASPSGLSAYQIQAQPWSVTSALAFIGCLDAGSCHAGTAPHSSLLLLVVAVAIVAVLGAVAIARRGRRDKINPTGGSTYVPASSARGYPSRGSASGTSPPATPSQPRPGPSQDPLGHLW